RIDTSCLLHETSLFSKYGYWRTHKEVGYAHDWEIVSRWVQGNEPWVATELVTLEYNNANQDMKAIRDFYNDQPSSSSSSSPLVVVSKKKKLKKKCKKVPSSMKKQTESETSSSEQV